MERKTFRVIRPTLPEKKEIIGSAGGWAYELTNPSKEFMYEVVETPEGLTFCCFDGERFRRLDSIEQFDHILVPPPIKKVTWPLPRLIEGVGNPPDKHPLFSKMVWDRVNQYIRSYLDLDPAGQEYYHYLTSWGLATWFQDKPLSTSPYPFLTGPKRTGKTRVLEVLGQLCFRAKKLISISAPAMYTNVELLQPTIFIDEADLEDEEKRGELMKMLLVYRPDMYVERKDPRGKGFDQLIINKAFCYKAIASRKPLGENVMDRSIQITMMKRARPLKRWSKQARLEAAEIRTQLLELRMRHWDSFSEVEDFDVGDDRVNELFAPIYSVAKQFGGQEAWEAVKAIAEKTVLTFEKQRRLSFEHDVVQAIYLTREGAEKREGRYVIPTSDILEEINRGREEKDKTSFRALASVLSRLGFEREYVRLKGGGKRCAIVPEGRLKHYAKEYGVEEEQEKALGEKLELVLQAIDQLKDVQGLTSKVAVQERLKDQVDHVETLKILAMLVREGKLVEVDAEHVQKVT